MQETGKLARRNALKQHSINKRNAVKEARRLHGGSSGAPKRVVLASLSPSVGRLPEIYQQIRQALRTEEGLPSDPEILVESESTIPAASWMDTIVFKHGVRTNKVTLMDISQLSSVAEVLETCKIADIILWNVDAQVGVEDSIKPLLSTLCAQGFPTSSVIISRLETVPLTQRSQCKKKLLTAVHAVLPEFKDKHSFLSDDAPGIRRFIAECIPKSISWRDARPFALTSLSSNKTVPNCLCVEGYVSSSQWSAAELRMVHVSGLGDFVVEAVVPLPDPTPVRRGPTVDAPQALSAADIAASKEGGNTTSNTDPITSGDDVDVQSLNSLDPLDGEQTWPTEEEMQLAEEGDSQARGAQKKKKRRIKGVSRTYQSAWISDSDHESDDSADEEEEEGNGKGKERMEPAMEMDVQSEELESASASIVASDSEGGMEDQDEEDSDQDPENETAEEREQRLAAVHAQRLKEKNARLAAFAEDRMFPDEVDVPVEVAARKRFARYRGLASFRATPWDANESLPEDYGRIYQFSNFPRTISRLLKESQQAPPTLQAGQYVQFVLRPVVDAAAIPADLSERIAAMPFLLVSGLHEHEHKMSVVHVVIQRSRHVDREEPITSKEPMLLDFGFRKVLARPIFSQHGNGDKHRFLKYLPSADFCVATFYGRVAFPPSPCLVYRPQDILPCAVGSLKTVDPNRLIIKRINLTGFPLKIHKRTATVRFMFFNPKDVNWFKPVPLWTKSGLHGNIKCSLGTHGLMKCVFNKQLQYDDTICMSLYKRVYPRFVEQDMLLSNRKTFIHAERS